VSLVLRIMCAVGSSLVLSSPFHAAAQDYDAQPVAEIIERGREVVAGYSDKRLAEHGILDVTKAPYGADASGETDSTEAIRNAVRDARDARLVAYFPPGTYLVSDTIRAVQRHVQPNVPKVLLRRDDFPCVLWGGTSGGRARLVLADSAPGFDDPEAPKPVVFVASYNREEPPVLQPNISFNNMVVSIDIELGRGNAGAIGLDHQGAQGSTTEDVHVSAEGAFAGFRGVSGSGGSASHISVKGGRYGLYLAGLGEMEGFAGSQPAPVISHVTLTGQTHKAVYCATRGPLTLVGALIEGPGIEVFGPKWAAHNGSLNLVDSIVRYEGEGPAITGNRPVCLSDVYVSTADEIVKLDGAPALPGDPEGWVRIAEYAAGTSATYPVWVDGAKQAEPLSVVTRGVEPPADLLGTHEWTEPLPAWDADGVANVRQEPYGATGDGEADDTAAIQKALDESRDVFLPKGIYRISEPLRLRSQSRFYGLGVYSIIEPLPEAGSFADASAPSPMLVAPNDADATCVAAFMQLWCRYPGGYAIHWQAGGGSIVRNVRTKPWPPVADSPLVHHPLILVDGNGGGRWYNAAMHYRLPQGPDHRHMMVRGTRQPLAFYMLNPEHSAADYMVEFDDVRGVRVYGLKSETLGANGPRDLTPILIRNSRDFRIFGHGGNATPPERDPLYRISDCSDFLLANFAHQPYAEGADPEKWHVVEEALPGGETIQTPGTEYLAVYRRR